MSGNRTCAAAAAALTILLSAGVAGADPPTRSACPTPRALTRIEPELGRAAADLAAHRPITIVALGSSSTEGVGASAPDRTYPSELERDLRARLPGAEIRVLNRGKGGEDAGEERVRLRRDVLEQHPELVIWQVGTNAVLRRDDLSADADVLDRGIAEIKAAGADLVLMDLQYAPRVLARPDYALMEQVLSDTAEREHVALFPRFAMMRFWQRNPDRAPLAIGPDGLHMNDTGYGCLADALADALIANWSSQMKAASARSSPPAPDFVAQGRHLAGAAAPR